MIVIIIIYILIITHVKNYTCKELLIFIKIININIYENCINRISRNYRSYSESVIVNLVNNGIGVPLKTFRDIFINLKNGDIEYGLIPIENSLGGSLHINYDLLSEYGFKIVHEVNFPINHCLVMHPKAKFKNIKKL